MTKDQYREEELKALTKLREFYKANGWITDPKNTYGTAIRDTRVDYFGTRVTVKGKRNHYMTHSDPTGITVTVEGKPRTQPYTANTADQLPWAKILARIKQSVELASNEWLETVRKDRERKELAAQAEKDAPMSKAVAHSLTRTLQPDGTYTVRLSKVLRLDQTRLLIALLWLWEDSGSTAMLLEFIENIKKREKK